MTLYLSSGAPPRPVRDEGPACSRSDDRSSWPWRGRGIGWRAQDKLGEYLFEHTSARRIQPGTHPENVAEQRSLEKAGFQLEGVIRSCEFRAGRWRDGWLYSRLRDDPPGSAS